jgi:hypothetical protein
MIRMTCPGCQHAFEVHDKWAGKPVPCPECSQRMRVPAATSLTEKRPLPRSADSVTTGRPRAAKKRPPPDQEDRPDDGDGCDSEAFYAELPQDLPDDVDLLGNPVKIYKAAIITQVAFLLFGIGLPILFVAMAIFLAVYDFAIPIGAASIIFLVCLVVGGYCVFLACRNLRLRVAIFTKGLLLARGSKVDIIPWDKIESLWMSITYNYTNFIYTHTSHKFTMATADGKRIVFDDHIAQIKQLGDTIQEKFTRVKLPGMLAAFKRGERLAFGPVSLDDRGLSHGKSFLPWDEVESIKLERGIFMIQKKGNWLRWSSVSVPQVPNLFIFMEIVDRVVGLN